MMVLMVAFFVFYAFDTKCVLDNGKILPAEKCHPDWHRLVWEWTTFIKCFWPCFALLGLHYLSKIAMNLHEIAKQNKNK